MYTITFYSFKGGVGRSLALVNVATQLARWGRRVLLVDFDLEAPGLDTFDLLKPLKPVPGVIEYVSDYIAQHEAPRATDYIYEVKLSERAEANVNTSNFANIPTILDGDMAENVSNTGRLWVMPAGRRDESYSTLFHAIDWPTLYAEHDGFLMFEDLKEQWKRDLAFDYILIDSRTGHTDIGGICTRQLPDAVVLVFFPNEQNLCGLETVVKDIRAESEPPRTKRIFLHFVMSNVPDLDDEDRILSTRLTAFRQRLQISKYPKVIHHYSSLALLNQTIFCEDRPRSRLAIEYRRIARDLVLNNATDREGALWFLREQLSEERRGTDPVEVRERLDVLVSEHPQDGDILTQVATVRMQQGAYDDALPILERAISASIDSEDILLNRAQCRLILMEDRKGASRDVIAALGRDTIRPPEAYRAVSILRQAEDQESLRTLPSLVGVQRQAPDVRLHIGDLLRRSASELRVSIELVQSVVEDPRAKDSERESARSELVVSLIGLGLFQEAMQLIDSISLDETKWNIQNSFNYAMAKWAATGQRDLDVFRRVVTLDRGNLQRPRAANYAQCLAIANWAIGDLERANQFLERARSLVAGWAFSCWRYLQVSPKDFIEDLKQTREMFAGAATIPQFIFSKRETISSSLH